jgi:hypothetical protein
MAELNSAGLGQHKLKSINVNANLLNAWTKDRLAEELSLKKKYTVTFIISFLGLIAIPIAAKFHSDMGTRSTAQAKEFVESRRDFDIVDSQFKILEPKLRSIKAWQKRSTQAHDFINQFVLVNNHAKGIVAITSLKMEASGGELHIKISGKTPSLKADRFFLDANSKDERVLASLQTSIQNNRKSGPPVFDLTYQKKVKLSDE